MAPTHAIGGVIGTTRQRLGGIGVDMVCDPGGIRLGRTGMGSAYSEKPNSLRSAAKAAVRACWSERGMRRACCHLTSARMWRKRFTASPSSALYRWRAASKCPRRCLACWLFTCKGSSNRKVGVVFGWPFVECFVFFLTGGSLAPALSLWINCSDTTIVHLF